MQRPRTIVAKGHTPGRHRYTVTVSGYTADGAAGVELRIVARGLSDRHVHLTATQARRAIQLLEEALRAAESTARHDGAGIQASARGALCGLLLVSRTPGLGVMMKPEVLHAATQVRA